MPLPMNCRRFFVLWRRWLRPLIMGIYLLTILVALPLMIVEFHHYDVQKRLRAWFIGGLFALLAIPIALWGILQHIIHYTQPNLQRHIIRILWMVPIYAINAWFGLRFRSLTIYLDTAREMYEAYVIYNFMCFLLNYLNREYIDVEATLEAKPQVNHLFPICWLPVWRMGRPLINNCRHGILQYTAVRFITTVIAFICQLVDEDIYGEGNLNFRNVWSYLVTINNFSQIGAMYCLVLFYTATREELAPMKPVFKFLCIKLVVFFSFWQGFLIAILVKTGVIKEDETWEFYTIKDVALGLQDFCICIEMFLAAIAHNFAFSHEPYVDNAADQGNCFRSFLSMWDVSDVKHDVVQHVKVVGQTATNIVTLRNRGHSMGPGENEHTPLLTSGHSSSSEDAPVLFHTDELMSPVNYNEHTDSRSIGHSMSSTGSFRQRDLTESMGNYVEFGDSDELSQTEVKRKLDDDGR